MRLGHLQPGQHAQPHRDLALAGRALDKAEKLAGAKDGRVLSVCGISAFEAGRPQQDLALAKQAVELARNQRDKARYDNDVRVMEAGLKPKTGSDTRSR